MIHIQVSKFRILNVIEEQTQRRPERRRYNDRNTLKKEWESLIRNLTVGNAKGRG